MRADRAAAAAADPVPVWRGETTSGGGWTGHVAVKDRVNAITLAPAEDFRRDSDLFGEAVRAPECNAGSEPR